MKGEARILLLDVAFRLIQYETGRIEIEYKMKGQWKCGRVVSQNEYRVMFKAAAEEWQSKNEEQIIERD